LVTLEVRLSNYTAQSLYLKYGLKNMGLRRAYYTDNREDAIIMSTDRMDSPGYREHVIQLKEAYFRRYAVAAVSGRVSPGN
jgi:ribosomal-protein-alanine N-acetyltransferase